MTFGMSHKNEQTITSIKFNLLDFKTIQVKQIPENNFEKIKKDLNLF